MATDKAVNGVRRIGEIADHKNFSNGTYLKPEDLAGETVLILGVEWAEGDYGTYAKISIDMEDGNSPITVTCGGKTVISQLATVEQNNSFPVYAKFVKLGKMWTLQ